jgi:L,D-transpeptidase YcbB
MSWRRLPLLRGTLIAFDRCNVRFTGLLSIALAAIVSWSAPERAVSDDDLPATIHGLIDARDSTAAERTELHRLYQPAYAPLWFDADHRPDQNLRDAFALLNTAASDGLDPCDYETGQLGCVSKQMPSDSRMHPGDLATFDVKLSAALLRYFRHLHAGRVDPRALGFRLAAPDDLDELPALLRTAIANHRLNETAAALRPPFAQYGALRAALSRYRSLAADFPEAWPAPSTVVRPGDAYEGIEPLHRRLIALGDLPAHTSADRSRPYEEPMVSGVTRFQVRHGLVPDGILGRRTVAALAVPLSVRVRQVELALERLRWLPPPRDQRLVAINIPMFRFWAWDTMQPAGPPALGMDIIVGRALRTETPVLVAEMREVIFRPY